MLEPYLTVIGSFGFPIFKATYVVVRLEKTLKSNTQALTSLKEEIIRGKK